ncbi:MAG: acetate--CoA ligase family protein [Limnobacter sp.]|nr:acetate--CoA ligase family protein [Limnobacter sp.]
MTCNKTGGLASALSPSSIAIVGASNDRNKVGGRPVDYLRRFGYRGKIYPVNPGRETVQGLRCYPSIAALPEAPQMAIIAVAGEAVAESVRDCATKGVGTAVILSSGFAETGARGLELQDELVQVAARAGMRLVGPNSQGLANFCTGAVANFSTMFTQVPPEDGPVAIVSQSGATSAALYSFLRERGVGVRYVLATGNEADLSVPELTLSVVQDPEVRLVVLYMESIRNPGLLAEAAAIARARGVPMLALKAGRSPGGTAAARSHTGALVNDDAVVDAFLERHAIWRAPDVASIVLATELYLAPRAAPGRRLVVISNSGSSCVMSADVADELGLELATLSPQARAKIGESLASFATSANPIDLTTALLGNSGCIGEVLEAVEEDPQVEVVLVSLPVAGEGYDLERIAADVAAFEARAGKTVIVTATLPSILEPFRARGLVSFTTERQALIALDQVTRHLRLMRDPSPAAAVGPAEPLRLPAGPERFLDESCSLAFLASQQVPVVEHELCMDAEQAVAAWRRFDSPVAVKACSEELLHKSEHGLVFLDCRTEGEVRKAWEACVRGMEKLEIPARGVIVARMARGRREFAIGARFDKDFGPVIMIGDGGKYIEALPDFCLLVPPFTLRDARRALQRLRVAPLFAGVRGEPPMDLNALCELGVRVGELMRRAEGSVASIDLNPVLLGSEGEGALVVDALIERGPFPYSDSLPGP